MFGTYLTDLRSRVLAAMEAGEGAAWGAQRFTVSRATAYRWAAVLREEGAREAKPAGSGPAPRIAVEAEAAMLAWAGEPHPLTLAAIAARLAESYGIKVDQGTMHRALRRAGCRVGWT